MPTYDKTQQFNRDLNNLDPQVRERFRRCIVEDFVPAMRNGPPYPSGLRIKHMKGTSAIYEMTFGGGWRATFQFDEEIEPGEPHIIWRRVGAHDVLNHP